MICPRCFCEFDDLEFNKKDNCPLCYNIDKKEVKLHENKY